MEFVGIIGLGWVGKAMQKLFPSAVVYDPLSYGSRLSDVNTRCSIAFVCVPTPLVDHSIDMSIVREVVAACTCPLIIIRSTLLPGTCDSLEKTGKQIVFMPEYLGESVAHPMLEMKDRPFFVIGGSPKNRRQVIELLHSVYNANIRIRQVTNLEAEVIKLSENRAVAFKIAQCQELYDACQKAGVDYYIIRDAVYGDDPRFNLWFTFVYPKNRGFQSKCLPKDVYGWSSWAGNPELTEAVLKYNQGLINGT